MEAFRGPINRLSVGGPKNNSRMHNTQHDGRQSGVQPYPALLRDGAATRPSLAGGTAAVSPALSSSLQHWSHPCRAHSPHLIAMRLATSRLMFCSAPAAEPATCVAAGSWVRQQVGC